MDNYILKQHKFAITQTKDGRWRTYLPNEKGTKGKEVRKKTRKDLERIIFEFYQGSGPTFKDCYDEWAEYHHRKCNNSDNTRYKYKSDYNRFLKGSNFEALPISQIDDVVIDEFLLNAIYDNGHITYKTFSRLYGYLNGTFKRARRLKKIDVNPMEFLEKGEYYDACKKPKNKTAKTELVTQKHFKLLMEQLDRDMKERPNYIPSYAVELGALTGMRVGELAVLKWTDINFEEGIILIDRSDKYNRITREWYVVESTKTKKARYFPIDEPVEKSLRKIQRIQKETGQESEWLFPHEKYGWTHSNIISSCLKNKCLQIGLERTYGIHAFRKTLNSNMRTLGVSPLLCSGMMGNSIEVNNNHYTYDTSNMEEKRLALQQAHEKMNLGGHGGQNGGH